MFFDGAPFPLTEEQQQRLTEPFVEGDFEVSLMNGKRKTVRGWILGAYAVPIDTTPCTVFIPLMGRISMDYAGVKIAQAMTRLLYVFWGDEDAYDDLKHEQLEIEAMYNLVNECHRLPSTHPFWDWIEGK